MKCHYEVLGIGRDASDAEIKTSYRKLALQWHPDKNLDQMEEAKEQFQLIQQAYEVLSDSHERTWYDNHREQILRGKNSNYEEQSLDLFQYFTVSCFKGYGDDPSGFYAVYREVFEKVKVEDAEFMDDEEDIEKIPIFGDSQSSYEEIVGPFYAYWQSYCTKKSYAWLCPYDITEIKDRRILREIEKDMKKVVQKAKKERNEEVRNLVAFVRKRDKRVQANKKLLEEKAAQNRQKQEKNRLEQIRRRQKELEEHQKNHKTEHNAEYEEQLRQLAQQYSDSEELEDDSSNEDDDDELAESLQDIEVNDSVYVDELYCVACNKSFKNENAFLNHETSKRHRENVERLRDEMIEEENDYLKPESSMNGCDNVPADEDAVDDVNSTEEIPVEIEGGLTENRTKGKKSKKNRRTKIEAKVESDNEEEEIPDILHNLAAEKDDWFDEKKGKKSKGKKMNTKSPAMTSTAQIQQEAEKPTVVVTKESKPVSKPVATVEVDLNNCCVTCKSTFSSKNKLFAHLKSTGHGVYIPKPKDVAEIAKKKGKRAK